MTGHRYKDWLNRSKKGDHEEEDEGDSDGDSKPVTKQQKRKNNNDRFQVLGGEHRRGKGKTKSFMFVKGLLLSCSRDAYRLLSSIECVSLGLKFILDQHKTQGR